MTRPVLLLDLVPGSASRIMSELREAGRDVRLVASVGDMGPVLADVGSVVIAHGGRGDAANAIAQTLRRTRPDLPVRVVDGEPQGTASGQVVLRDASQRHFGLLIGESPPMARLYGAIRRVASVDVPILLRGESGTGKELVSAAIHRFSRRRDGPLVRVNCAALPGSLLETELFGHRRGAFTGAVSDRVGRLETASGGTLFLDEIDSASLPMQGKLLRAIEQQEFQRVGEDRTRKIDIRIIAATNAKIRERMEEQSFRMDLYYRLAGIEVDLPPLRARGDDVIRLFSHFALEWGRRLERDVAALDARARSYLEVHPWPGNVRQLWNVACSAVLASEGRVIRWSDLPTTLHETIGEGGRDQLGAAVAAMLDGGHGRLYRSVIDATERHLLEHVLRRTDGNIRKSARILGIARNTLKARIRRFGLLEAPSDGGTPQAYGAGLGIS